RARGTRRPAPRATRPATPAFVRRPSTRPPRELRAAAKPPVREADRWKGSGGTGRFPQLPSDPDPRSSLALVVPPERRIVHVRLRDDRGADRVLEVAEEGHDLAAVVGLHAGVILRARDRLLRVEDGVLGVEGRRLRDRRVLLAEADPVVLLRRPVVRE